MTSGRAPVLRQPSARERQVIGLVVARYSNDEIAVRLAVSRKTVEFHLTNLYRRYGLAGRVELALHAVRAGWVK